MTELAAFKDTKPQGDLATAADGKNATYQIYYRPEQAKFSNSARVREWEEDGSWEGCGPEGGKERGRRGHQWSIFEGQSF